MLTDEHKEKIKQNIHDLVALSFEVTLDESYGHRTLSPRPSSIVDIKYTQNEILIKFKTSASTLKIIDAGHGTCAASSFNTLSSWKPPESENHSFERVERWLHNRAHKSDISPYKNELNIYFDYSSDDCLDYFQSALSKALDQRMDYLSQQNRASFVSFVTLADKLLANTNLKSKASIEYLKEIFEQQTQRKLTPQEIDFSEETHKRYLIDEPADAPIEYHLDTHDY